MSASASKSTTKSLRTEYATAPFARTSSAATERFWRAALTALRHVWRAAPQAATQARRIADAHGS